MAYQSNQFQSGVSEAIRRVTELVLSKRVTSGGTNEAIRTVARDCNISAAQVRRLFQPSRYPKDIGVGLWLRIAGAYRRYLLHEIGKLEAELRRVEAMGNIDPGTVQDLAAETEALVRRIKQHL